MQRKHLCFAPEGVFSIFWPHLQENRDEVSLAAGWDTIASCKLRVEVPLQGMAPHRTCPYTVRLPCCTVNPPQNNSDEGGSGGSPGVSLVPPAAPLPPLPPLLLVCGYSLMYPTTSILPPSARLAHAICCMAPPTPSYTTSMPPGYSRCSTSPTSCSGAHQEGDGGGAGGCTYPEARRHLGSFWTAPSTVTLPETPPCAMQRGAHEGQAVSGRIPARQAHPMHPMRTQNSPPRGNLSRAARPTPAAARPWRRPHTWPLHGTQPAVPTAQQSDLLGHTNRHSNVNSTPQHVSRMGAKRWGSKA
jgi:hypothetical protein